MIVSLVLLLLLAPGCPKIAAPPTPHSSSLAGEPGISAEPGPMGTPIEPTHSFTVMARGSGDYPATMAYGPRGSRMAIVQPDVVELWDLSSPAPDKRYEFDEPLFNLVNALAVSEDGNTMFFVGDGARFGFVNLNNGDEQYLETIAPEYVLRDRYLRGKFRFRSIVPVEGEPDVLLLDLTDGFISVSLRDRVLGKFAFASSSTLVKGAFSANGRSLFVFREETEEVWANNKGDENHPWVQGYTPELVEFHQDVTYVDRRGDVLTIERHPSVNPNKSLPIIDVDFDGYIALKAIISPQGTHLALINEQSNQITLVEARNNPQTKLFEGYLNGSFSPDGSIFFLDQAVKGPPRVYSIADDELLEAPVDARVASSFDGSLIVTKRPSLIREHQLLSFFKDMTEQTLQLLLPFEPQVTLSKSGRYSIIAVK
ncbi:MAG: hypothetical protein HN348_33340, partial [Proteobacteria bacterium]|nr:hypothetical protein [Pseudomonadota bacterium]